MPAPINWTLKPAGDNPLETYVVGKRGKKTVERKIAVANPSEFYNAVRDAKEEIAGEF